MTHLSYSLKNLGKTFTIQRIMKTEIKYDENFGETLREKKTEWLDYFKNDALSSAFSYARYITLLEKITGFGMKDCFSLPKPGWKYFNCLSPEEDEPIYTYYDKHMSWIVRRARKGERVCAFNQYYESKICVILNHTSEETNVKGNIYNIIEVYLYYKNKHLEIFKIEYENKFKDYRDIDEKEMEKFVNEKLSKLPIHQKLKQKQFTDSLKNFDTTSLYPSAIWDEDSKNPRIETDCAYTKDMNDDLVENFKTIDFNQRSAILKIKYHNPKILIVLYLPVKERTNNIGVNRMRNGNIVDALTSVDIQELIKVGGKVVEIYEGVIYRESFKVSPFRNVLHKLIALRQKYTDKNKEVMQLLVKLLMNSFYEE